MPKRIATPPSDTNTRYFTVCFPYPLNANWELKADQIAFSRWIACCIQKEFLIAIMYKPTARGMVIIEVDRAFKDGDHGTLLGEHRWKDFLRRPNTEERSCCSQIFYSVYSDHRGAQKDGWKTINIRDDWFNPSQWSPSKTNIKYPYPLTHWCAPPAEDKTNKRMCRPLPVATFPPPPKASRPVVGSSAWIQSTTAPDPKSSDFQRAIWGNNNNILPPIQASNSANNSGVIKPAVRLNAPSAVKTSANAWGSQQSPDELFPAPKGPIVVSIKPPQGVWGSQRPPVAVAAATQSTKAWGTPKSSAASSSNASERSPGFPTVSTSITTVPLDLVRSTISGSFDGYNSSLDWASEVEAEIPINGRSLYVDDLVDSTDNLNIADSMDLGLDSDEDTDVEIYLAPVEDVPAGHALPHVEYDVTTETVKQNLWEDVVVAEAPQEDECPVHGVLCSKGICQVAKKNKKKANEQKEKKNGRRGRGPRSGGGWKTSVRNSNDTWGHNNSDNDNDKDDGRSDVHGGNSRNKDSSAYSSSITSTPGSRSVSREAGVKAQPQAFDHHDLTDPFADF
ncbi:hypothetical protein J3R30DRAFT_3525609 [Lentinula aciculospora]|uniref:Uncharacterized protein n=1 Tax=Lentinula aciculospora TaxID=153920 RepID=A0A9W9A0I1_9AGAR|nr:hypothetical protein J3R30DRAFT_3525609 [Lentinula aciculospora]